MYTVGGILPCHELHHVSYAHFHFLLQKHVPNLTHLVSKLTSNCLQLHDLRSASDPGIRRLVSLDEKQIDPVLPYDFHTVGQRPGTGVHGDTYCLKHLSSGPDALSSCLDDVDILVSPPTSHFFQLCYLGAEIATGSSSDATKSIKSPEKSWRRF